MIKNIFEEVCQGLDQREKDVILRKFGFFGKRETLESISKDYELTRERIRQIQEKALNKLSLNLEGNQKFFKFLEEAKKFLRPLGFKREDIFLNLIKENLKILEKEVKILKFFLDISKKIPYYEEDDIFYGFYAQNEEVYKSARHALKRIYFHFLERHKNCHPEEVVLKIALSEIKRHLKKEPDKKDVLDFLKILKIIGKNPFDFWGIKTHPEISPKSLTKKIYLVLKNENRPLHFTSIHKKLKEFQEKDDEFLSFSWKRDYNVKSIKNELIKNPKFILVGKGTYALKEWGLLPGTSKEVLVKFLKKYKKIKIEDLWNLVSKHRPIKKTSFYIYLKDLKNKIERRDNFLIYHD